MNDDDRPQGDALPGGRLAGRPDEGSADAPASGRFDPQQFDELAFDLRDLFGSDLDADLDADLGAAPDAQFGDLHDVSAEDAELLRSLFAADVADAPPPATTVDDIVAAARAAASGRQEPDTDRIGAVPAPPGFPPTMVDGPEQPAYRHDQHPVGQQPSDQSRYEQQPPPVVDELAARRRSRLRTGLLAAAAVAVLAIGIPVAINLNNGSSETAGMAEANSVGAASTPAPSQAEEGGAAGDAGTSSAAADAEGESVEESDAANPGAAPTKLPGRSSSGAGEGAGAGEENSPDDSPADSANTAAQEGTGAASEPSPTASAEPVPPTGGPASSAEGSGSTAPEDICEWPPLPAAADDLATSMLGEGVVDGQTVLTTTCRETRVAGGVFPAADGSRNGVTVEAARAPEGSCESQGCAPDANGVLSANIDGRDIVWIYSGTIEVTVAASEGMELDPAQLAAFGTALADQLR